MRGLLQILRALLRDDGSDEELERVLCGLVEASVAAEFNRVVEMKDEGSAAGIMEIMDDVVFIIQVRTQIVEQKHSLELVSHSIKQDSLIIVRFCSQTVPERGLANSLHKK
jgi:hypothetical protein